ncbi:N-6 DNA Methylase [Marinomonas aquimarina]|uniref:site-specific DNA-methyltransferase (adenine-specific) n=1 Tax=Marinomonas aquimarina TaxID=295068 RepID=A0A1A8T8Z1_9GAMM|nr:BREX-1 system adenine-specific DNA-methyltransferase PglX [Marinomonas aquimarina]SBS28041.1 N-6 DNA Methylase [Marinomonas aquimarina]
MNTAKLKKYAPQARREFITAVSKQLNQLGIYSDKQISEVKQEGSVLLIEGKTFEPCVKTARERLVKKVQAMGYNQLVEQVAYTWFNRLCAVRYMEIHDYLGHGFRVLSHPDNPKGFEIIDHAQDATDELGLDRARIIELKLAGNKDEELYRELLLGQCHKLHEAMPFLFDALDDETELLLPDNLTRTDSILRGLVDGIPEEDWQQVEVIGWLYQFYISEKKDQVMGKVVKSEDIPAATQLFTPNWIVKYLVQNSVGRQWLQTYPDSAIKTQMEYYIEPAEQSDEVNQQLKAITPESIEPETIKVLDPACGSGHILIEAYNVLKAIYEERGFRSRDIPKMILENNLYGLDIDDRAAQLSGFALMMMARDDDKRIFTRNVRLNVLALQESNHIDLPTLWKALNLSGSWQSGTSQGLFSDDEQDLSSFNADNRYQLLKRTLARFTQAKTFGSLIDVPSDEYKQLKELLSTLVELQESGDSMQKPAAKQLIEFVHQALVLSTRYDAVIANPPYMGGKGMNAALKDFAKKHYPHSKSDLFAIFMERTFCFLKETGLNAQINMQSWMFLGSFEKLRRDLLSRHSIHSLLHIGYNSFPTLNSKIAQACAFVFDMGFFNEYRSTFIDLNSVDPSEDKDRVFRERNVDIEYYVEQMKLSFIPGAPIAFWISECEMRAFTTNNLNGELCTTSNGVQTGDNDRFVREWFEVDSRKIEQKWFPYNKGGPYQKWFGNGESLIDWEDNGKRVKSMSNSCYRGEEFYFEPCITWTDVTWRVSARYLPKGYISDAAGPCAYFKDDRYSKSAMGLFNTPLIEQWSNILNPTLHFQAGDFKKLPFPDRYVTQDTLNIIDELISITSEDLAEQEWHKNFKVNPLVERRTFNINNDYSKYLKHCQRRVERVKELEVENLKNAFLAYNIQDKDLPKIKESLITLQANPLHRFSVDVLSESVSDKFRSTICSELLSFSVGCMLGRFSLSKSGIVYSYSSNEGFTELVENGSFSQFTADEDGIIPLTDQEWFKDDATNRLREFVQVVWGEEHLQENLDFVAESLCLNAIKPKKSESALETIRRYLSTQFYKDHLKTYKKRPIYWLFSSGKQKAFECLVYLHRYNEGTLSRMRTEYVTPLLGKYDAYAEQLEKQIETADSTSEANRFKKELDALIKKQVELREFDDKLKHYADMCISLDLDDGVKVNYGKFGDLLADVKAITGSAPEVN